MIKGRRWLIVAIFTIFLLSNFALIGNGGAKSNLKLIYDTIADYRTKGLNYIIKIPENTSIIRIRDYESMDYPRFFGYLRDSNVTQDTGQLNSKNLRCCFSVYLHRPPCTRYVDKETKSVNNKKYNLVSGWNKDSTNYVYDYTDLTQDWLTIVYNISHLSDTTLLKESALSIRLYLDSNFIDTKHNTIYNCIVQ